MADTGPCEYRVSVPCWEVIAIYHRVALQPCDSTTNLYIPTGPSSRPVPPTAGSPVYLDLAYLPGGGAGHLDQDFFLRVRALCYVISGQGQRQEEGLRAVLDALLAGKQQWDLDLQVSRPQDSGLSSERWSLLSLRTPVQSVGCFPNLWGQDTEARDLG